MEKAGSIEEAKDNFCKSIIIGVKSGTARNATTPFRNLAKLWAGEDGPIKTLSHALSIDRDQLIELFRKFQTENERRMQSAP